MKDVVFVCVAPVDCRNVEKLSRKNISRKSFRNRECLQLKNNTTLAHGMFKPMSLSRELFPSYFVCCESVNKERT